MKNVEITEKTYKTLIQIPFSSQVISSSTTEHIACASQRKKKKI